VLPRFHGERKGRVVQFLYESGLIAKRRLVLNLRGADMSKANLSGAELRGADLSEAYLSRADLSGAFLNHANLSNLIGTTFERYEQIARFHLKPALGRVELKALTPAHLRSLYRERLEAGSSVRYIHTTLHKALKQAVMDGLNPRNVTEAVKPPQPSREEISPLTPEQAKHLLQVAHETENRLEALYVLAIHTGLRQGELLGLKWDDVDLDGGSHQVRRTLAITKNGSVFTTPKTSGSRRSVKLTQRATEAFRSHLERQLGDFGARTALYSLPRRANRSTGAPSRS
jgi:integrase